ncbi:hypothetical protein DRO27_05220 [Candidatus Bathyarchaeota archaeon]|nr:MAG: hypothetical protein DRO27_05220 [Candidatus Bathyarchaeota archaeon]
MMTENNDSEKNTEAFAYTPGLKVKRLMTVSKERRLPLLGDILVEEGASVSYDTIVAKTEVPGDPRLVKVSAILGIDQNEVHDFLHKKEGDKLEKGEVFGSYKAFFGLINRKVTSPIDGEIESVSKLTGQVIIRPEPVPVEVNAYIPGKVVGIMPREGVVVATQAAFIQGILGLGGEAHGEVRIVVDSPKEELTADKVSEDDKGRILIGGSLITFGAFKRAVEVGVSGLVAGGMNYTDVTEIMGEAIGVAITGHEEIGITLIITEGFGKMNMATRTFDLLKSFEGYVAAINGATQIRAGVLRPEIIIPHDEKEELEKESLSAGMTSGTPVRIIREPNFGAIGKVASLPVELMRVESGSKVRVLVVRLDDGTEVTIPRANVEIIEE